MSGWLPKKGQSGAGGLNGVDAYGGTPQDDGDYKTKLHGPWNKDIYPDAGLPKGVNVYGGTTDDKKGADSSEFSKDTMPTAGLPKGVNEYGGVDNNEQTAKKVQGKWQ